MENHFKIDNCGFNVTSVQAMSEEQFITQYRDQRQHGMSAEQWEVWMKNAYAKMVPNEKPKKSKI